MGQRPLLVVCAVLLGLLHPGSRVLANGATGDAVVAAAEQFLDVREATGRNDGPAVEAILAVCGMPAGASWCGALVYVAHVVAGVELPGEARRYAWAPTWMAQKRRVRVDATRTIAGGSVGLLPGDVFGVYHAGKQRIAHVGVVRAVDGEWITTVEGNTNSGASREGDGCYSLRRRARNLQFARWN